MRAGIGDSRHRLLAGQLLGSLDLRAHVVNRFEGAGDLVLRHELTEFPARDAEESGGPPLADGSFSQEIKDECLANPLFGALRRTEQIKDLLWKFNGDRSSCYAACASLPCCAP